MTKFVTLSDAEKILNKQFRGHLCSFLYPGYTIVYGIVDRMAINTKVLPEQEVIIFMNSHRYTVSLECLHECLKIIPRGNTSGTNPANGSRDGKND